MNIFEINSALSAFELQVDEETGELLNADELDALKMARDEKIEGLAMLVKELNAEADEIKNERDVLDARMKRKQRKAEGLKKYLQSALAGAKFETARCEIGYRKSQQVILTGEFDDWAKDNAPDLLNVSTVYKPDKLAIKEAIKGGRQIEGATLIDNVSMQIK